MIPFALLGWAATAVLLAGAPSWGWRGLGMLALLVLAGWWAGMLSAPAWRWAQRGIAAVALVQCGWMAMQAAGYDPLFVGVTGAGTWYAHLDPAVPAPAQGWFGNPMDTALFLAMSLPALAALHPVAAGLGLVALVSLTSTAALAAAVVFLVERAWRRGWTWGLSAACLSGAGAVWFVRVLDPAGLGDKPLLWSLALDVIRVQPLTGYGLNVLGYQVVMVSSVGRVEALFSEWLQWTLEAGVLGLGLALAYLGTLAWRVVRTWPVGRAHLAPVLMTLLLSLISIPFRLVPVALLAACYVGRLDAEVSA